MRASILLYHWFEDPRLSRSRSPEFGLRPEDFRAQLDWLLDHGYSVLSLDRLVRAVVDGAALPRRSVAITFDDAYEDFRLHALPALVARGLPATLYAVAGLVGKTNEWDQARGEPPRRLLDWAGLREVAAGGVEIGAHSWSHPDMRTLGPERLAEECQLGRQVLEQGLGRPVRHFAYPFGRYNPAARAAARAAGYDSAGAVVLRPADLLRSDRFALMRVIVHGNKSLRNFGLRVRLAQPWHRVGG